MVPRRQANPLYGAGSLRSLSGLLTALVLSLCSLSCGRMGFDVNGSRQRVKTRDAGQGQTAPDSNEPRPPDDKQTELLAPDAGTPEAGSPVSDLTDAAASTDASTEAPAPEPPAPDPTLVHHYSFDGTGTTAVDTAGQANGTLVGTTLTGMGSVVFTGGTSGPHVTLPAGLISRLESVSVEAWLTWNGGTGYQRVFDFGNSTNGSGAQGAGTRHFSLALNAGGNSLRLVFDVNPEAGGTGWRSIFSSPVITTGEVHQLVAVFDRGANEIRLYVDGALRQAAAVPANERLSDIDDVNNWLGMAQWSADPNLQGTLHDVRLYNRPLTHADVKLRFQTGYD